MTIILYVDGGTRGSVICLVDPYKKKTIVKKRRGKLTNNDLEYLALIYGLEYAKKHYPKGERIIIKSDSKLIVNQVNGIWNINTDNLIFLAEKARIKKDEHDELSISWTPRENNLAGIYLEDLKDKLK